MSFLLEPLQIPLRGMLKIPGDKSISHRAVMIGSLAAGETTISNFLDGEDCLQTIDIFRKLGVHIEHNETNVRIQSKGYSFFKEPTEPLYFGNSGTTARLLLGILSGLSMHSIVYGDPHLTIRPMERVITPLRQMGARIDGRSDGKFLPLSIRGGNLRGIRYEIPVKSAQ